MRAMCASTASRAVRRPPAISRATSTARSCVGSRTSAAASRTARLRAPGVVAHRRDAPAEDLGRVDAVRVGERVDLRVGVREQAGFGVLDALGGYPALARGRFEI